MKRSILGCRITASSFNNENPNLRHLNDLREISLDGNYIGYEGCNLFFINAKYLKNVERISVSGIKNFRIDCGIKTSDELKNDLKEVYYLWNTKYLSI